MGKTEKLDDIEKQIYSTFASVTSVAGYSDLHGKILAVLLVEGKPLSLQEVARKTGYSSSMISLSLDFLEVMGIVKKVKKTADRKLYLELHGDLLQALKNAIVMKAKKSASESLMALDEKKKKLKGMKNGQSDKMLKTLEILEKEIKRLEGYIDLLSVVELPEVE